MYVRAVRTYREEGEWLMRLLLHQLLCSDRGVINDEIPQLVVHNACGIFNGIVGSYHAG